MIDRIAATAVRIGISVLAGSFRRWSGRRIERQ
jgi:hypothetical protein